MERNSVAWKSKVKVLGLTGSIEEVNLFGLKYDAHEWRPIKLLNKLLI